MRNLTKVLGVRINDDLHARLVAISTTRGEDVSDFVRRAILKELAGLSFLSDSEKKALGISV